MKAGGDIELDVALSFRGGLSIPSPGDPREGEKISWTVIPVLSFAALLCFSALIHADENHAVSSNSGSAIQPTHSSPLDDLPIRRHSDETAHAPTSPGGPGNSTAPSTPSLEAPRVLMALALVIGLIFTLRWAARRFFATPGTAGGTSAVQVLSRSPLSPRQQVVLIRVGRRVLVVSDNGQQLSSLAEISDADEVAALLGQVRESSGAYSTKAFGNLFQRFSATTEAAQAEPHPGSEAGQIETTTGESDGPAAVATTRAELGSLMERVRLVSQELGRS